MATLFSLHLSRHVYGFGKPAVYGRRDGLVGYYVDGQPYKPDHDEVRAALPHYWRRAFDRSNGAWWFPKDANDGPAYVTLKGSRGQYLNTVYAFPYQFNPGA